MMTIYVSYVVMAVSSAILLYTSRAFFAIKLVALASVVVLGLGLEAHYRDQLGAPIAAYPEGEFEYVYHSVQGDSIYLWVWNKTKENRLYVIPYDQETAEELEKAKQQAQEGDATEGTFVSDRTGSSEEQNLEISDPDTIDPSSFTKG